ncbi:MAG: hypothetical protein GTN36_06060 [Candidatus Aenigmarchaeota archaeon]|nr:hypothetical protein [Candidatus Aenigmarchaeota archaeon]
MDTLFHFVFPVIAALAARIYIKHPVRTIFAAAIITLLVDLDHFIGVERTTFHNIFITVLIPIFLILLTLNFKSKKHLESFSFLLLIFLSSHAFVDLFSSPAFGSNIGITTGEGIALLYPFSGEKYSINFNIRIPLRNSISPYMIEGYLVSSLGFGILLYFILILVPCLFLDNIIEISERKHEKFIKSAKEFFTRLSRD